MRWSARTTFGLAVLVLAGGTGCQSAGLRFLSLIGLHKDPLVVALVADTPGKGTTAALEVLNPFGPYSRWQSALGEELGRPVGLDLCLPLQLPSALDSGLCHVAVVSPAQYARMTGAERFSVVGVPADEQGRGVRPALLVVKTDSPVQAVADLRGKTVAFGPAGDARTHEAGLALLAEHGLKKADLSLELLPLPGSLKHMPSMRGVAQSVINGSSEAGFLDEAAWEELPATAEGDEPARDKLRIVARTAAVPDSLIIASPKLDPQTFDKVRAFLLEADEKYADALRPLHVSCYRAADQELVRDCFRLARAEGGQTP